VTIKPLTNAAKPAFPILMKTISLALLVFFCACQSPAGPIKDGPSQSLAPARGFKVGVGTVDVTPDKGYPLAGFGGGERRACFPILFGAGIIGRHSLQVRQEMTDGSEDKSHYLTGALGSHDPLQARAMVILPEGQSPLVFCRLDLVIMSPTLQDRVLELTQDLQIRRHRLLLAANHTHSGVGAYHQEPFPKLIALDNYRPEIFEKLAQGCATAIRQAFASARPASLAVARAMDLPVDKGGLAKNRRARALESVDKDDKDPEILALVARGKRAKKGRPGPIIGVLLNYAIHPTILGMENLYFSADVAGGLEREVSKSLPGQPPVLFFNGAEGDIGPNTRGLSQRGGLMACKEIGQRCAKLIKPAILKSKGHDQIRMAFASAERDFGSPFVYLTPGSRETFFHAEQSDASWITFPLTIPFNLPFWALGAFEVRTVLTWNLRIGMKVRLDAYAPTTNFRMGVVRMILGDEEILFAQIPGEATHDLGLEIKESGRKRGAKTTFLIGLCNDAMSYIASREKYYLGNYEAMATLFGPETGPRLVEGLNHCMDKVYPTK
jgi:neutral ceramidase